MEIISKNRHYDEIIFRYTENSKIKNIFFTYKTQAYYYYSSCVYENEVIVKTI